MNSVAVRDTGTPWEFVIHSYGTAERLPFGIPLFQAVGNLTERYRIALGFYATGDSSAWVLSSDQFRDFLRIHALSQLSPGLLQLLIPSGVVGPGLEEDPRQRLVQRIIARRDAIERARGILPESYPLFREDRNER